MQLPIIQKASDNIEIFKKLVEAKIYLSPRNMKYMEISVKWLNEFEATILIRFLWILK